MDLVVNEWLPEYFRPDASEEEKAFLNVFYQKFNERKDRIIIREPSPFINKIFSYAKEYQDKNEIVIPIRDFIKSVLLDSDRCVRVSEEECHPLPESVKEKLAIGNYGSDEYLFEAVSCIEGEKIIVTTDARLQAHLQEEEWCKVVLLSDFLDTYYQP